MVVFTTVFSLVGDGIPICFSLVGGGILERRIADHDNGTERLHYEDRGNIKLYLSPATSLHIAPYCL